MEDYCKKQYIFFNEKDRIKYEIKRSKHLYNEFKTTLNRGFSNLRHVEDHPNMHVLLNEDVKIDAH